MPAPVLALTGGTGFLGRHCVKAFTAAGWQLRVLVRQTTMCFDGAAPELIHGDLSDPVALGSLLAGADAVLHLAGLTRAIHVSDFTRVNAEGAGAVAAMARRLAPDAPFILASSLAAREPCLSDYAASKEAGEQAVRAARADATILRLPIVYGPGDAEGARLVRLARWPVLPFASGRMHLTMLHAADAASACLACAAGRNAGRYELCDGRYAGYGAAEIFSAIAAAAGHAPPRLIPVPDAAIRAAGMLAGALARRRGIADLFGPGKARELLHRDWSVDPASTLPSACWQPRISLDQGMRGLLSKSG